MDNSSKNLIYNPRKNIFILTSPFQLFIAEHMIKNMTEFRDTENILLFEKQYNLSFARNCWSSAYTLADIGYSPIGFQKKNAASKNLKLLLNICNHYPNSNQILFSNIHYALANYLFFNSCVKSCCTFSLIMDGIGSYTGLKITVVNLLRDVVKFCIGHIGLGIKYRPYSGNYLGDHFKQVRSVYGFQSQYLTCDQRKRKEVPLFRHSNSPVKSNNCVFLDQNTYEYLLGYSTWKKMLMIGIDYLTAQQFGTLYYKAHPGGNLRATDLQYLREKGFVIIEDKECIERLFPTLKISVAVSFNSTSLFMLKCIYGDSIRCISLLERVSYLLSESESKWIKRLYQTMNVELC